MAKKHMFAASALTAMALGIVAPSAQALVSSTDAPNNEVTNSIAQIQTIDKKPFRKLKLVVAGQLM